MPDSPSLFLSLSLKQQISQLPSSIRQPKNTFTFTKKFSYPNKALSINYQLFYHINQIQKMIQMGLKPNHNCQIDCTNHDEVINKLEIKSKDLYYFWRNYEWLYNKYYSQKAQEPSNNQKYQQLEDEIHRLETENKKLRIDNQALKKKQQTDNTHDHLRSDYEKQIERLKSKNREYESIRDKLTMEINSLKSKIRQLEETHEDNENRLKKEIKRQDAIIVELQQNIDEIRNKMMNQHSSNSQMQNIQQRYQREIQKMKVMVNSLQSQCQQIVEQQFQNTRYQLLQEFPRVFEQFSRGDLSNIVILEQFQEN